MRQYTISELGTLKNGLNFSAEKVKNGIKMVGVPNFADNFFVPNYGLAEVNKDVVPKEMLLQTNDILFVRSNGNKALVGRTIIMNNISEPTTFSGFCIRFRPNTDLVSPLYLLYLFKSPLFRKLFSSNQQTSISNLNQEILGELKVNLPTLERQNELVAAIHCLTRKIEANKVINDNLQQMAFDTYMHLFFKKQPTGTISDIIIENSKSPVQVGEAKETTGSYPFFTSGDAVLEWNDCMIDGRNCYLNTGGNAGVKFYIGKAAYSTDTWCISAKDNLADYLYLLLCAIKPELNQKFFQGTGLKHLQKPLLKDRRIYIPAQAEAKDFNAKIQPMFDMISANIRENQNLIKLRDWLLPMLMNGQATISD